MHLWVRVGADAYTVMGSHFISANNQHPSLLVCKDGEEICFKTVTTAEQLPAEVGSWSQETHESVQASTQQHLREGIEFSSRDSASAASATLSHEARNIFETTVHPATEEAVEDASVRGTDAARASVSSTEATQQVKVRLG